MSLSLPEWLTALELRHPQGSYGIELGLQRVTEVKNRLALPILAPVILVGGTNGKGSTCAMLDAMLSAAGYRVGRYSSPHLLRYNERIRVASVVASDAAIVRAFEQVDAVRGDTMLTYFEFGTLAAWAVFAESQLDVVILEVGLGGRLDATNIFDPACCIVTTVDIDHVQFLGADRETIGFEKAGIFRPGVPAICGDKRPPQSLLQHAANIGAALDVIDHEFGYRRLDHQWSYWHRERQRSGLAYPALRGANQLANASCAITAVEVLRDRLPVTMQDIRRGLLDAQIAGRFQVLPGQPVIVLDVAHNAEAVRALAANLGDMAFHPATWAIFGMMADKDIHAVIEILHGRVDHWLPCALPGQRAASVYSLSEHLLAHEIKPDGAFASPAMALAHAQEKANEADRILVFGSFLTVAGALEYLGRTA